MKRLTLVALAVLLSLWSGAAVRAQAQEKWSPEVKKIIAAAQKEGKVSFYGVNLSPQDVKKLERGFNRMFGTSLVLEHEPSRHFGTKAAKMVSEARSGLPAENDAVNMGSSEVDLLARQGVLRDMGELARLFPYIKGDWLVNDRRAMVFWHGVFGPVYNTNLVPKDKLPRTWEDLLSPAWKNKMIMSTALNQFTALAETWGVERVKDFLERLKKQNVAIQRGSTATLQRLASGEFPLVATQIYGTMKRIQRKGAPIAMDFLEPVPVTSTYLVLPKKSLHPNAGLLFAAFIMSPQGHAIYEDVSGLCSIYVETCSVSKLLKGKKLALMSPQWALKSGQLVKVWSKALGLQAGR